VPRSLDALRDRSVASNIWYNVTSDQAVAELILRDLMRKGEQTRQEIIRKAAPIFNQRGYDGAALSDLMRATGLEKGGIYRHFDSKQQLAAEAFDYAWQETLDARIHDLNAVSNTVDRLKQLVANFVERRGTIPGGCPLLNTAIDTDDGNSVLRERARRALHGWRNYLVSIIRAGIKAREIRSAIDAKKLATLIISSLEGAIMVYRLERNEKALRTVQAHLNSYLETEVRLPSK
jgi:TetR/AcrR family transcriptional regulator, transcriptional repressor for nem operon